MRSRMTRWASYLARPGRRSFTPALRRIVTRAGGNPLFLEESLSMLVDAGALVSTASGWTVVDPDMLDRVPTTVRAMIAARLDGLPPDEKWVLQCASITGELSWDRLSSGWRRTPTFERRCATSSREISFGDDADRTPRARTSSSSSTP